MNDDEFLDTLLNLPAAGGTIRSPNGKYLAFVTSGLHGNIDVFYMELDNPSDYKELTNTPDYTSLVEWWPDSNSIIVSQDVDGNEREVLYRVYLDKPNDLVALTQEKPDYFLRGPNISSDAKSLYYFANYDFIQKKELEISHLYHHNLETGVLKSLTKMIKPTYNSAELSIDGKKLLYNRSDIDPSGDQFWIINVDGTNDREILNFGDKAKLNASLHPDSNRIVFTTDHFDGKQLDRNFAGIYNITNKDIIWLNREDSHIDESLKAIDINFVYFDEYEPNVMIFGEVKKAKITYYLYKMVEKELTKIPRISGNISISTKLLDGSWICEYYSSNYPTTIVKISENAFRILKHDDLSFIFDNFRDSDLVSGDLIQAEEYDWKSEDQTPIHGWLYKSNTPSDSLMVYVHGGPTAHSRDLLNTEIQYYLRKGFNVLDPNYRGSTGYGVSFRESIKKDGWGGREQVDIAKGVESLINSNLVKKGKIAITGTSYGGYSAWCAITMFPHLFDVAAPVCGMTDLVVDYKTTRPDLRPYSEEMMGGSPVEVPERYHNGSPINYIQNITGKLLIIQGANDPNVHPDNVTSVTSELHQAGVEYEELIFADEGHGIVRKENRKTKFKRISDFVDKMINDNHS